MKNSYFIVCFYYFIHIIMSMQDKNLYYQVVSPTPLHLSYIYAMENEIGRRANEYYGMVKVQLWFLDGMADAEFNKPRQFPENGAMYYRQHAYHQGYEQWKIVKERR